MIADSRATAEAHATGMEAVRTTPILQGIGPEELARAAAQDEGFGLVASGDDTPMLVDAFVAPWHNKTFFYNNARKLYTEKRIAYLAIPFDADYDEVLSDELADTLSEIASDKQMLLFYDYYDYADDNGGGAREAFVASVLDKAAVTAKEQYLGEDKKSHAHVFHHVAEAAVSSTSAVVYENPKVEIVEGPDMSDEHIDSIWHLYKQPFQELAQKHPIKGNLSRDGFEGLAKNENLAHVLSFDTPEESRELQAFGTFSSDLRIFDWIDIDFFEAGYPPSEGLTYYAPTVVTNMSARGVTHISGIMKSAIASMSEQGNHVFTFECSDASNRYIPTRIQRSYDQLEYVDARVTEIGKQVYRAALIG